MKIVRRGLFSKILELIPTRDDVHAVLRHRDAVLNVWFRSFETGTFFDVL